MTHLTDDVVIVSAVRTPIGQFNGLLKDVTAIQLGAAIIRAAITQAGILPEQVDEVIMGNALQSGLGQNPARLAALEAGLSWEKTAMTVNKVCGSGLKAIQLARQSILTGENEVVIAGGMESMSQAPYLLRGARSGFKMGNQTMIDSMLHDGLWCSIGDHHMGITAENLCDRFGLTRSQLDLYASESQRKAAAAYREGHFREEIVPLELPQRKGDFIRIDSDEALRPDTTPEGLAKLRPAFRQDGRVTAGNSSTISDGAAALVIMSAKKANMLGLSPLAVIRSNGTAGVEPALMGIGPVPAVKNALEKANLRPEDIGLAEINEAFAAQSLACAGQLGFDPNIVNVNGGAIALGHPIGASGARIVVTLLHEMKRRSVRYGAAALCIGGGQGIAAVFERPITEQGGTQA